MKRTSLAVLGIWAVGGAVLGQTPGASQAQPSKPPAVGPGPSLAKPPAAGAAAGAGQAESRNSAIVPVGRPDNEGWMKRHAAIDARVKQGDIDLVFIGDSITEGWEGNGKEVWEAKYGARKAANLGISGDRTQHVLWRLDHGAMEGIHPKVAVVMIGTNNSNGTDNTAAEIAAGIKAVVEKVHEKSPETRVLLLGVFPRGERPDAQRDKIYQVNREIKKLDDGGKTVKYLDIGKEFLKPDYTIPAEIMPDYLHLSPKGYEIWAKAIEPTLDAMLAGKPLSAGGAGAATSVVASELPFKGEMGPTLFIGEPAPRLAAGEFIKGERVDAIEKGKVYVVEFWATWCVPCVEGIPHLTAIQKEHKDVVVIGVASSERGDEDNRRANVARFVREQGDRMGYRVAYDATQAMMRTWYSPAGQRTIPCAFIVDAQGKIAWIGNPAEMDGMLERVVAAAKKGT